MDNKIASRWSATLPLSDYGRVARQPPTGGTELFFVGLAIDVDFSSQLFDLVAPPFSIDQPPMFFVAFCRHDIVERRTGTFVHQSFPSLRCPYGGLVFVDLKTVDMLRNRNSFVDDGPLL